MDLDHRLLNEAIAAGAEDYQGTRVETIDEAGGKLVLDGGQVLTFKVLIGADGAASPVARHLFGRAFDPNTIGFAFEAEVPGGCEEDALMSIDFRIVDWGYGWNFPKKDTRTIGLGALKALDQDLMEKMKRYLVLEGVDPESVKIKGAHIPLGDYHKVPGRANVLLAGDAAGMVDGITGEGLAYAMESGAEAAEAAAEAIRVGKPANAIGAYRKRVKYIHAELDKANKLRHFEFSDRFAPLFKEKLASSATMRQAFFDLLQGEMTYSQIERRIGRQMLTKLTGTMTGWPSRLAGKIRS
jgi:flavin-dependent dehydrogenase